MASNDPKGDERRRSQRIALAVDLYVVSLDPSVSFRGRLNTIQVSRHGCLVGTRRPFRRGTLLRVELFDTNRSTTAQVVHSDPTRTYTRMWNVALELAEPGNFWGIDSPPQNLGSHAGEV